VTFEHKPRKITIVPNKIMCSKGSEKMRKHYRFEADEEEEPTLAVEFDKSLLILGQFCPAGHLVNLPLQYCNLTVPPSLNRMNAILTVLAQTGNVKAHSMFIVPSFLSSQPPAGRGRWPPFLVLVLPVEREFFLSTVASCTLRTEDWIREKFQSVGFLC